MYYNKSSCFKRQLVEPYGLFECGTLICLKLNFIEKCYYYMQKCLFVFRGRFRERTRIQAIHLVLYFSFIALISSFIKWSHRSINNDLFNVVKIPKYEDQYLLLIKFWCIYRVLAVYSNLKIEQLGYFFNDEWIVSIETFENFENIWKRQLHFICV